MRIPLEKLDLYELRLILNDAPSNPSLWSKREREAFEEIRARREAEKDA